MTNKDITGKIETAYGKSITEYKDKDGNALSAINYTISVPQFETAEEVRGAGEWPKDSEVVSMVNARKVAAKRQEAIKENLDTAGVKAPTLEDDSVAIAATAKILLARKKAATQEEAEVMAREVLGL